MVAKTPRLLTAEQRDALVRILATLSERDLGRFHTLSARDLEVINRHRRPANRPGVAVHVGLLRFPGRTLADVPEVPRRIVEYISEQVGVDADVFEHYGERDNTIFEHLDGADCPVCGASPRGQACDPRLGLLALCAVASPRKATQAHTPPAADHMSADP